MLENVNQAIPDKNASKGHPNSDSAARVCRAISSELNAVKFDPHLLRHVGKNVAKALNLFRSRVMQTLESEVPFLITGSHPGSSQLQKIDAVNCLFTLSDTLWDMLEEYSGTEVEEIIAIASSVSLFNLRRLMI